MVRAIFAWWDARALCNYSLRVAEHISDWPVASSLHISRMRTSAGGMSTSAEDAV